MRPTAVTSVGHNGSPLRSQWRPTAMVNANGDGIALYRGGDGILQGGYND